MELLTGGTLGITRRVSRRSAGALFCHKDITPDGKCEMNWCSSTCQTQAVVIDEYIPCHARQWRSEDLMTCALWICADDVQRDPSVRVLETLWIVEMP